MLDKVMEIIKNEKVVSPQTIAMKLKISIKQAKDMIQILQDQGIITEKKVERVNQKCEACKGNSSCTPIGKIKCIRNNYDKFEIDNNLLLIDISNKKNKNK